MPPFERTIFKRITGAELNR